MNENYRLVKEQLGVLEKKLLEAQQDLLANEFSTQSATGRQLMAKCKRLQEENEQFGKEMAEGSCRAWRSNWLCSERFEKSSARTSRYLGSLSRSWRKESEMMQQTIFNLQHQVNLYQQALAKAGIADPREAEAQEPIPADKPEPLPVGVEPIQNEPAK